MSVRVFHGGLWFCCFARRLSGRTGEQALPIGSAADWLRHGQQGGGGSARASGPFLQGQMGVHGQPGAHIGMASQADPCIHAVYTHTHTHTTSLEKEMNDKEHLSLCKLIPWESCQQTGITQTMMNRHVQVRVAIAS